MARQRLRVFVACGTHVPFTRLLRALVPVSRAESIDLFVQGARAGREFITLPGSEKISRGQFAERLEWAHVVVAHGGAGTLYEALRAGHHPIAAARLARFNEIINDHQLELIEALARRSLVTQWVDGSDLLSLVAKVPPRGAPEVDRADSLVRAIEKELNGDPEHHDRFPKNWFQLACRALINLRRKGAAEGITTQNLNAHHCKTSRL